MKFKYDKIMYCVVSHLLETGHIFDYFLVNTKDFYIYLYAPIFMNGPATLLYYKSGKLFSEEKVWFYKGKNKMLVYIFTYIQYLYFLFKFRIRNVYIITSDPIFLVCSKIQTFLFKNKKILWLWDYFPPKGFPLIILNAVINYYVKRAKIVLFLTDNIKNEYSSLYSQQSVWKTISLGIKDQKNEVNVEKNLFGFIGNLKNGQGLELVFSYIKENPLRKLEIVGNGSVKEKLINLVKILGIEKQVIFFGYKSEKEIKKICSRWEIGFALYDSTLKNNTHFADPSKTKLYLEFGLPVIMTKVTYFQKYLQKYNAGICINYSLSELSEAVNHIQKKHKEYLAGVAKLAKTIEYNDLYSKEFLFLENE